MPKISVIVPVYKVEEYLSECVNSILAQSFTDFELILIDDGSPDNCWKICDNYAVMDKRVVVIHQENGGLSAARNAGIDVASGKYITFIDSDDLVSDVYLEVLYKGMVENNCDVSTCKYKSFSNTKPIIDIKNDSVIVISGKEAAEEVYQESSKVLITAWGKLYRTGLFDGIRFPNGRIHEDQAIVPKLLYKSRLVCCSDIDLYFYRVRGSSITHDSFSVKRYDDIKSIDDCIQFFRNSQEDDLVKLAEKRKMILLCCYSIEAKAAGIHDCIPKEFKISEIRALKYLKNNLSNEKYTYYLAKVHPKWIIPHEYMRKIKKALRMRGKQ